MSDVLFRYLLMARRRERSFFRRLFIRDDRLLESGVEQLVESACARVEVKSQHERIRRQETEVPASRHQRVQFYDVPQPNRPSPGSFEKRDEEFPLRATLKVFTCSNCSGRGELRCGHCGGRGHSSCGSCGGSGKVRKDNRRFTCGSCGGSGSQTCSNCHGSGWETCYRCRGEGQLASWESEIYEWRIEDRDEESYPHKDRRLRRAFRKWLKIDADQLESFAPEAAAEHLGFETPEALEVAARADEERKRLEEEARQSSDRYLFHRTTHVLTPTGYTVVRSGAGTARYFWLVGRGAKAQEVRPPGKFDGRKLLGWMGVSSGGAVTWETAVRLLEALTAQILDPLQIFLGMPAEMLAGGAAASGLMVLSGARRLIHRPPPVLTVGLLPSSGEPTSWLTCLAYLGSYTERLRVLDRAYDTQLERLLGKMRPKRQSESLTVELADGRRIRLIEVGRPSHLSDEQLRFTMQALDGIMILEEVEQSGDELEARLRAVASDKADANRITRVTIDRAEVRAEDSGAIPIEAIRQEFLDASDRNVDWERSFDRLWSPIESLLTEPTRG